MEKLGPTSVGPQTGEHGAHPAQFEPPEGLRDDATVCFVEKPFESYDGLNVRLRYFVRVTILRQYSSRIVHEETLRVHVAVPQEPEANNSIKMEVGIEDCLHIEFEYNKSKYHLKDAVLGKIFFLLVRIKIKHMELAIIKRETTGTGANTYNENETVHESPTPTETLAALSS